MQGKKVYQEKFFNSFPIDETAKNKYNRNKVMHLSAIAYNLKKYLKFDQKRVKSGAMNKIFAVFIKMMFQGLKRLHLNHSNYQMHATI